MTIKITVVIPTYNRSALLIRCLEALTAQTLPLSDFEVIVVNDGEDPQTERVLKDWIKCHILQVKYMQSSIQKGPAAARNLGWLSAKTNLIAFTDDDCIPSNNWLADYLSQYAGQRHIAWTGKTRVPMPEKRTDFAMNVAQLETADFITANCACTKSALIRVGGFDERFKMAWREDSDLEFKFLTHNIQITRLSCAEVVHPVRKAPWGISIKEQKKGIYDALLFKKFPLLYREKVQSPIWNYYLILGFSIMVMLSTKYGLDLFLRISAVALIFLFIDLVNKRLKNRHKSPSHVAEMVTTSMVIPFLSIYWRFYGAIKYRVFFI